MLPHDSSGRHALEVKALLTPNAASRPMHRVPAAWTSSRAGQLSTMPWRPVNCWRSRRVAALYRVHPLASKILHARTKQS
jgi:hypothetical protein